MTALSGVKVFPARVWEATGVDEEGRNLWSSREATPADHKRRRQWLGLEPKENDDGNGSQED